MMSSAVQTWQTPRTFCQFLAEVWPSDRPGFPDLDLDPCSPSEGPNPWLAAKTCFTKEQDGLAQRWAVNPDRKTRGFVNSEYGDAIGIWVARCRHYAAAPEFGGLRAMEIVGLWPSRTDTAWYQDHLTTADALLHWSGRLPFDDGSDSPDPAPFPSVVPYWGEDPRHFARAGVRRGIVTITRGPYAGLYPHRPTRISTPR